VQYLRNIRLLNALVGHLPLGSCPRDKIVDVVTNVKNAFVIGDFFRFPNLESCVYTAKKVANIIAKR